jgi:hypothetical protein
MSRTLKRSGAGWSRGKMAEQKGYLISILLPITQNTLLFTQYAKDKIA